MVDVLADAAYWFAPRVIPAGSGDHFIKRLHEEFHFIERSDAHTTPLFSLVVPYPDLESAFLCFCQDGLTILGCRKQNTIGP